MAFQFNEPQPDGSFLSEEETLKLMKIEADKGYPDVFGRLPASFPAVLVTLMKLSLRIFCVTKTCQPDF